MKRKYTHWWEKYPRPFGCQLGLEFGQGTHPNSKLLLSGILICEHEEMVWIAKRQEKMKRI